MQNIPLDNSRTVPSIIAETITKQIKAFIYKAGERLPSRMELAQMYDVHENTIKKVFRILEEQKLITYQPHRGMIVLKLPRGAIKIALVVPTGLWGLKLLLKGLEEACESRRASLVVLPYKDKHEQAKNISSLLSENYSGAVLHPAFNDEIAGNIIDMGLKMFPMVLLGFPNQQEFPVWRIDNNYFHAAYIATERLLEYQHRHIGILVPSSRDGHASVEGYCQAMAEYGKLVKSTFILHVPDNEEKGFSTAKFLAENSFRTKALIYASPKFAMQGLEVIKARNIRIGRDISVISIGDFQASDSCEPPISVLRYNYLDTGRIAADMLFRRMRQPEKLFCESSKGHWDFIFRETSVGIGKQPLCLSELQKQRWNERFRTRRSIW